MLDQSIKISLVLEITLKQWALRFSAGMTRYRVSPASVHTPRAKS